MVDERTHTDFVEKIVEAPKETIYIDDITDVTIRRNEKDISETRTNIRNTTNIENTINVIDNTENVTTILKDDRKTLVDNTSVVRDDYNRSQNLVSLFSFT